MTNTQQAHRVAAWQRALASAGMGEAAHDRVLLTLPLWWAVGEAACFALQAQCTPMLSRDAAALDDVLEFGPTILISTVSDALRLTYEAAVRRVELADSPLRLVVVTGEPGGSLGVTRRRLEDHLGAVCLDVYSVTELGQIGWSCPERPGGIHLDHTELSCEFLDPDSERPARAGELAELVVTTPENWTLPAGRFRTGDLMRPRRETCPCGHNGVWLEGGVLGRATERLDVRGQVLLPSTIEQIVRRHPAVVELALRTYTVCGGCEVALQVEATDAIASEGDRARVAAEVAEDLKRSLGLRMQCDMVPPGGLATAYDAGRRARRLSRQ